MKYAEEIRKLEIAQKIEVLAKEAQKIAEEIGFSVNISTGILNDGTPYPPTIAYHPNHGDCILIDLKEEGVAYEGLIEALKTDATVS